MELSVLMGGVVLSHFPISMLSLAVRRAPIFFVFMLTTFVYLAYSTRSQAQLKAGISGLEAREAEDAFFRQHSYFKGCDPKLFGVTNLTTRSVCVGVSQTERG